MFENASAPSTKLFSLYRIGQHRAFVQLVSWVDRVNFVALAEFKLNSGGEGRHIACIIDLQQQRTIPDHLVPQFKDNFANPKRIWGKTDG